MSRTSGSFLLQCPAVLYIKDVSWQEYLWTGQQFYDYDNCHDGNGFNRMYDDHAEQPFWVSECDALNCKRFKEGCPMGGGTYQHAATFNTKLPTSRVYVGSVHSLQCKNPHNDPAQWRLPRPIHCENTPCANPMNAAFIKSLEKKRACAHGVDCSTIKSEADKSVAHWRKLPGKVYAEMRNLAALDSLLEPGHRKAKVKAETDLKARVKKQAPWTPEEQHILENTKANHERPHTYNMCACIHA